MVTLAIAKPNGGVAKTNLMGNLGADFAAGGKRVVLVDLDPQATLTPRILAAPAPQARVSLGEEALQATSIVHRRWVFPRHLRSFPLRVASIFRPPRPSAALEALDGYVQVTANLQRLRDALDLPIPIVAVVPNRFDNRLRIARDVLEAARGLCNGTLTTPIRENVVLRDIFGHRQPIRTYRPDSRGAADYAAVAAEVFQRAH